MPYGLIYSARIVCIEHCLDVNHVCTTVCEELNDWHEVMRPRKLRRKMRMGVNVMVCEGRKGRSAAHCLSCSLFPVLRRGHSNMFVIRTVASIGEITAVRLWHYNVGPHPKWSVLLYLYTLSTNTYTFYFLNNSIWNVWFLWCLLHDVLMKFDSR